MPLYTLSQVNSPRQRAVKGANGCERSSQGFAGEHTVVRSVLMSARLSSRGQGHGGDAGSAEAWPSFCPRRGARGSNDWCWSPDSGPAAAHVHVFVCACVCRRLMASASTAKRLSRLAFFFLWTICRLSEEDIMDSVKSHQLFSL